MNENQKSFTKFAIVFIIIVLVVISFKFYGNSTNTNSSNGNIVSANGETQVVKMHVEGSQYILEPSSFTVGKPVRIEADMSRMPGCSKSIVISALGIRKTLTSSDNVIEFTPTKAGTFNIACSMNMYRGTFTILESSGTKSSYVEQAPTPAAGGSCGGSGGCGCGG